MNVFSECTLFSFSVDIVFTGNRLIIHDGTHPKIYQPYLINNKIIYISVRSVSRWCVYQILCESHKIVLFFLFLDLNINNCQYWMNSRDYYYILKSWLGFTRFTRVLPVFKELCVCCVSGKQMCVKRRNTLQSTERRLNTHICRKE